MSFLMWLVVVLFLWTVCSVLWFLRVFAHKGRKTKWYDNIFAPPILVIAQIIMATKDRPTKPRL